MNFVPRTVEPSREVRFGDRHADSVGDALTQRTGGGLDTRREVTFRMYGVRAVPLSEALDVPPASVRNA
jgi:hypothetical protein